MRSTFAAASASSVLIDSLRVPVNLFPKRVSRGRAAVGQASRNSTCENVGMLSQFAMQAAQMPGLVGPVSTLKARSSSKCNGFFKRFSLKQFAPNLIGRGPVQGLAWPLIHFKGNVIEFSLGDISEVHTLGQIVAQ